MNRTARMRNTTTGDTSPPDDTISSPPAPSAMAEASPLGHPKRSSARWLGWLFGLALLVVLALLVAHHSEEQEFAQLLVRCQPAWLIVAVVLQLSTYVADARIWQRVLVRAGLTRPLRSFAGLGLAKLFMDQAVPSIGLSGTLLVVRALDRRAIPRGASMAAVVVDLVSYYLAYVLALIVALVTVWVRGTLTPLIATPAALFGCLAAAVPTALLFVSRGGRPPSWALRLPIVRSGIRAIAEASPGVAHDARLIVRCSGLQLAILVLDAGTLWVMLQALGISAAPPSVFASFMLSTLARTLGVVPGGLGVFEAVSVATLRVIGVPAAASLAATLLFRGVSFWLPLVPGMLLARRESRA